MKMKNRTLYVAAAAMIMAMAMTITGFAAVGWQENDIGWWYSTSEDESSWYSSCWQWLDGNADGIAECYCFDGNGYIYVDTITPDGYTVNPDGAWTVDGVVQTIYVGENENGNGTGNSGSGNSTSTGNSGSGSSSSSETVAMTKDEIIAQGYNEYGISNVAIDMLTHTREENAKYGETGSRVRYARNYDNATVVYYANGFTVYYSDDYATDYNDIPTYFVSIGGAMGTCADMIEGADPTIEYATEARDYLKSLGFSDAACSMYNDSKHQNAIASFNLDGKTIYLTWNADPDNPLIFLDKIN